METAEQFLKGKNIKTYGAIICDGQQLVELLTEFAQKQASFISSKQDVIKSVCQKCGVEMEGATYKGYKMCHICREWQTVL